jgi:Glycosyltransferase family 87
VGLPSGVKWYAQGVPPRLQLFVPPIVFVLVVVGLYALLRSQRDELVDFVVPRTAAFRYLAHEPLYQPDDGHYQYKYFPAFAQLMVPFTWVSKEVAQFTWFTLTVAMTWAFVSLSIAALPERRLSARVLFWLTLLLNGKFLVKELAFGQFNLPVALLMLGAVMAAQHGQGIAAGALVAAGVFVKPYALVLVPWLALAHGWRPLVPFGLVLAGGLLLPAASYGWNGNLTLLHEWYRTVTDTTGPNLLGNENISFASSWTKWIGPGTLAARLALASAVIAVAAGVAVMWRRRHVAEPNYLEAAYLFVLIPLLSPQGWDYVLLIALPAYMCLVDRWRDLSPNWRAVVLTAFFLTSFTIFDLLRRPLYFHLMELAAVTVGAVLIAACLIRLRWRAIA